MTVVFINTSIAQKPAKKIIISGIVTDAGHKPVPGAMVLIDNKKTNSITDTSGFYKIKVRSKAQLISIFTFTSGMSEALINGRTKINFTLPGSGLTQNAVQKNVENDNTVHVGYGTINNKNLTTAVDKIEGKNKRFTTYQNIYELIQAEVPGVQVSGNSVVIRGQTSLNDPNGNSTPLYVVEGNIVSSIDDVLPTQVKSIEILKGSSAAIYGAKGSRGVILIHLLDGTR